MDTGGFSDSVHSAVEAVVSALAVAVATVVGGILNAWAARRKQRDKDLIAARMKIRELQERMGVIPNEIDDMDDVFCAIRRITARLNEMEAPKDGGPIL